MKSYFPFSDQVEFEPGETYPSVKVVEKLWPILTAERQIRIDQVVSQRCFSIVPVLENIYDRGNISAVLRSAEAFGLGQAQLIETGEKFKESQRTTAGADKWVELHKWKSSLDCVKSLKDKGFQVVATCLSKKSISIFEVDASIPTAVVLGNEKLGISEEMKLLADKLVILPMYGFVQSFNISVAGALSFQSLVENRIRRCGSLSDLTLQQQQILRAIYAARTLDSASQIMRAP